jgi:FAD/FMN-containing dehydrogenase
VWNRAVRRRPAIVAFCKRPEDVQAAGCAARRHGVPMSVRGDRHDWAGRALRDDGLVIDLTGMRNVAVNPRARVANVAGGARAKDVAAAAGAHSLVAAMGNSGTVGMAGLTLGGGYGPLSGACGLAADNLLGAEIVLADGRRVTTDAEPDLLWALRGGGNFGVVTSLRVRLHPVRDMLAGSVIFTWNEASGVLCRYAAFAAPARDELGVSVGAMSGPNGEPVIMVVPLWSCIAQRWVENSRLIPRRRLSVCHRLELGPPLLPRPLSVPRRIHLMKDGKDPPRHPSSQVETKP